MLILSPIYIQYKDKSSSTFVLGTIKEILFFLVALTAIFAHILDSCQTIFGQPRQVPKDR
jgi:hypothetical protein